MEWFNGNEELFALHFPNSNLARAAIGPYGRIAGSNLQVFPLPIFAEAVYKHAAITGRQNVLPSVAKPIERQQSVNDSLVFLRNEFAFPISRAVHQQWSGQVIRIGEPLCLRIENRSDDQHLAALPGNVCEANPMRRRHPVDFFEGPWTPGVSIAMQDRDVARALGWV